MKRVLYVSAAAGDIGDDDIARILAVSRVNNAQADVTGMLLHIDGSFMQVLEGPEEAVDTIYDRIGQDSRHRHVHTLWSEPIERRGFGEWSMGYDRVRADDPRWNGAFLLDPQRPALGLAPDSAPEVLALLTSFQETAAARV